MAKPKSRHVTTIDRNSRGKRPRKSARAVKAAVANRPRAAALRPATRPPDSPFPPASHPAGLTAPGNDNAPLALLRAALPAVDWSELIAPPATTAEPPLWQELAQPIRRRLTQARERRLRQIRNLRRRLRARVLFVIHAMRERLRLLVTRFTRAVTRTLRQVARTITSVPRAAVARGLAAFAVIFVAGAWIVVYFWVLAAPRSAVVASQPQPTPPKQFNERIAPVFVETAPPVAAAPPVQNLMTGDPATEGEAARPMPPASGSKAQAPVANATEAAAPPGNVRQAAPAPVKPKAKQHRRGRSAARGARNVKSQERQSD